MAVEQIRVFLLVGICLVAFMLWQAWQRDYASEPQAMEPRGLSANNPDLPAHTTAGDVPDLPAALDQPIGAAPQPDRVTPSNKLVMVHTDTVIAGINPRGGAIETLALKHYPASLKPPRQPLLLLNDQLPDVFMAQSGLLGGNAPNHHGQFIPRQYEYRLEPGKDAVTVVLDWSDAEGLVDGLVVTKRYTFYRDSYRIGLAYQVTNDTGSDWQGRLYGQFQRTQVAPEGGIFRTYTYTGGVLSSAEKLYEKYDFEDMADQNLKRTVTGGWVAMIQHYFAGAWVPDPAGQNHYYSKVLDGARYALGVLTPAKRIADGATGELALTLYAGPKIQDRLAVVAPHLDRTVDYGWLWLVAQPLFVGLTWIHHYLGNWGWSIIVLTLLIKLLFFHLSAKGYRSMARMRKIQPRIMSLRERYANDKQRMNQAMMQLYKEEKINPLGGCFPILVQIPVFIALYWVLLESVELRQAPFIGWLTDLSEHDPYFVLPLLMGITMYIQQKLNPAPPDPIQARIMSALPIVFTFLFLFFPSGLVLYWFVNNLLSILQQWVITKQIAGNV